MENLTTSAGSTRRSRRQVGQINRAGRASKVFVAMCMFLATVTATQATALAVDEGDWVTVKCTEKDGVYWKLTTKNEEQVHKAVDDCTKVGGTAVVSA